MTTELGTFGWYTTYPATLREVLRATGRDEK